MDDFDDNFIVMDSDVIIKKDISDLYDEKYIYVGEKFGKLAFWRPRVLPYILFINNKMRKSNNINFFDEKRMAQINGNTTYDTGSSFLEDTLNLPHRVIMCSDYVEHLKAASWAKRNVNEFIEKNKQYLCINEQSN